MWMDGAGRLPGQLFVVSGPSGAGKSTVLQRALNDPAANAQLSISATTREPRAGEVDGVAYYFQPVQEFVAARSRGELLEWAEYSGNFYGTPARPVLDALKAGRNVILEIEVEGAKQVRDFAPCAFFIFLRPPLFADLERRLEGRGSETDASLQSRLRMARRELAEAHWYDAQIINDDPDQAVRELVATLTRHGSGGPTPDAR